MRTTAFFLLIAATLALALSKADAQVSCEDLPGPRVYVMSGDTQLNLLKRFGRKLRDNTSRPISLVFTTTGSCAIVDMMYNRMPSTGISGSMQYVPSSAEDPNWDPSKPTLSCTPPPNKFPDIGISALFNSACPQGQRPPPNTVALLNGPRQAYVMAMPRGTDQVAITYEEAYLVFGFGPVLLEAMSGAIAPWIAEPELQIRTTSKSTLLAWAASIDIPAAKWKGNQHDKSTDVVSALTNSAQPTAALGILGAEVYDGMRDKLTALAFRAKGQYAAYYPDSTATSRDKKNVRDGHYTVWSPTVWMDHVVDGAPVNTDARYVIDLIGSRGVTVAPNFSPISVIADVGLVPDCAMRVDRSVEGGPLRLYKPGISCTCKYESLVDTSSCQTCSSATPCSSGVCRDGYCEEF
jgi:hypothetical protein